MKTQIRKPVRERANYTEQYKQEALELWRASGRSAARVAAELGIRPPLLYRWANLARKPDPPHSGRKPRRSAVLDICTRRVLGWSMSPILDAPLTIAALRMALGQRPPRRALIVHSDRGRQFASAAYRQLLARHGLLASMSRKGNCYDNAFIESFWSSLKYEVVYHRRFATHAEARTAIFDYIETFYNRTRLHSSLAYRSPITFESNLNK